MKKIVFLISMVCLSVHGAAQDETIAYAAIETATGYNPLHVAIIGHNLPKVRDLLSNPDFDINTKTPPFSYWHGEPQPALSPLLLAAKLEIALSQGEDEPASDEETPFRLILRDHRTEMPSEQEIDDLQSFFTKETRNPLDVKNTWALFAIEKRRAMKKNCR